MRPVLGAVERVGDVGGLDVSIGFVLEFLDGFPPVAVDAEERFGIFEAHALEAVVHPGSPFDAGNVVDGVNKQLIVDHVTGWSSIHGDDSHGESEKQFHVVPSGV